MHCVWIKCSTLVVWERLDFVLDLIHFSLCCMLVGAVGSIKLFTHIKNKTNNNKLGRYSLTTMWECHPKTVSCLCESMLSIVTGKLRGTGKTDLSVWDFAETFFQHSLCCVDRHWKVEGDMENKCAIEDSVSQYFTLYLFTARWYWTLK